VSRLRAGAVFIALAAVLAIPAQAHPPGVADQDQEVAHQVEALREAVKSAADRKDERMLRAMYADNFTHTHASGHVDRKAARIATLLSGEQVIETVPAEELHYRVYRDHTIVVSGTTMLQPKGERRPRRFRWMSVYAKTGPEWQLIASQATRVAGD
jgi:hypothetical protein